MIAPPAAARAERLADYVGRCTSVEPTTCWGMIESDIGALRRTDDGRTFCLPRTWGATHGELTSYPVAFLDHVRSRLAAARFGQASAPHTQVLAQVLGQIYPCS